MNLCGAIVVFAYNEERNIARTIENILANLTQHRHAKVHVMVNGCTDRTAEIVRSYARQYECVRLNMIGVADKCNAWNTYVHEIAEDDPIHVFMDGDVTCSPNAFAIMAERLDSASGANAIGGVPQSGRNRDLYIDYMKQRGWLFGNLYAVRGAHLNLIRQVGLRLPIGLRGNDHFITRFMHSDLTDRWQEKAERVIFDVNTGYRFASLMPYKLGDIRLYYRRLVTYRWRQLQLARIAEMPLMDLPSDMREIDGAILADLRAQRPRLWDHITRQVMRNLERRYESL